MVDKLIQNIHEMVICYNKCFEPVVTFDQVVELSSSE